MKTCKCHTCNRWFHPLGIMRHRAMHRDRQEDCRITYTHGDTWLHEVNTAEIAKAAADLAIYGTAAMLDGKHIPLKDLEK